LHKFWALCPQYGVIRSDALRKTRLYGRFIGNDFVLLAELAMLGEFWEVPEVLFQRRIHAAMSTKANRRRSDLLRWVDPSSTAYGAFIPPTMRLGYEYVRSIRQLPLTTRDRWLCYITAPAVWYTRELRNWSGRQKSRLFNGIGSRAPK
jgi:hypothetical protein